VWKPDISGKGRGTIFIHLEFDNYVANYLGKMKPIGYSYNRMIPPGKWNFFWTINNNVIKVA